MTRKIIKTGEMPPLDRWRADQVLEPNRPIWGAKAIANFLGLSVVTVRRLAKSKGVPITKPEGSGSYFAYSDDLVAWLNGKNCAVLITPDHSCALPKAEDDAA